MRLEGVLSPELTIVMPAPRAKGAEARDAVLRDLSNRAQSHFPRVAPGGLLAGFLDRERKYPTGTPEAVAFPHVLLPDIDSTVVAALLVKPGVRWSVQDLPPQDLVFAIFGNADKPWEHVRLLARLARIARGQGALDRLREAADGARLYDLLITEDRRYG